MDDAALPQPEAAVAPAPNDDSVFVVTSAFGDHVVGDEVSADVAEGAPSHAVVRRGKPTADPQA